MNIAGAKAVGRVELALVAIKLGILGLLIGVGGVMLRSEMPPVPTVAEPHTLLASVGLAFFAYAGYGMMANAAQEVPNPERTMPRAFALAIGVVIVLYVLLAIVVLGNVAPEQLARFADTAVAEAAQPVLGKTGFVLVSIAALLATASAINATLFAVINIATGMGRNGALPALFVKPLLGNGTGGLLVLLAIVLVVTNLLDLSMIANAASATFLLCYLAVFAAAWRLRRAIGASAVALVIGAALMAVIFGELVASLVSQGHYTELGILLAACVVSLIFARWCTPRGSASGGAAPPAAA